MVITFRNMHAVLKNNKKCDHSGLNGMTVWDESACDDKNTPQCYVLHTFRMMWLSFWVQTFETPFINIFLPNGKARGITVYLWQHAVGSDTLYVPMPVCLLPYFLLWVPDTGLSTTVICRLATLSGNSPPVCIALNVYLSVWHSLVDLLKLCYHIQMVATAFYILCN